MPNLKSWHCSSFSFIIQPDFGSKIQFSDLAHGRGPEWINYLAGRTEMFMKAHENSVDDAPAPSWWKYGRQREKEVLMGDKGGKKDKEKGQKQKAEKQKQKSKINLDKQPKRKAW